MKVLSVTQLTRYVKEKFDGDYLLNNLWVKGEISNFKRHSSGHLYFTLKDDHTRIGVVMFRSRAYRLPFFPENGMSVMVRGYVSVYERDGCYQLYAEEMEPDGLGALYIAFEQLKARLQGEGLFDAARKRQLPKFPKIIGLVTSPGGAAVRDMIKIISHRWPPAKLVIVPVTVQGEHAPQDISRGIEEINRWGKADLIIVGRGGGSLEELWAFNTEVVARAVAGSQVPVISAVGHETDVTICDFVADVRAATPSQAAEMAVPDLNSVKDYIEILQNRAHRAIKQYLARARLWLQRVEEARALNMPQRVLVDSRRQHLDLLNKELQHGIELLLSKKGGELASLAASLQSLSPLDTLSRGYSLCTSPTGRLIRDAAQVELGSRVEVQLHRGKLTCTVKSREV
ncbi:exodeoxyribonuclease VII large subunit [Desulfofalx alkaliphila]|uniref:exodeoxyribonuclease VII large subunit n=1 Tax=Desulfofalx alkaliphila TaxID=105483 RepID=UPI0004E1979E|nr:exodeoxyribonuclease VII large subunit [Desulfofalx alkaliphila]